MKAVIMAGGKGTRLRPLTCNVPKPMVPLLDRPVMEYTLELLKRHGLDDIVVTVQYLPDVIRGYFADGSDWGVRIRYAEEDRPLGTAGSVKQAESVLTETFVVISGDALTDFNLTEALAFHRSRQAAATLVLTRVETPLEFGVVMTDGNGDIVRFLEKPGWGEVFSDTVNTGIYILEPHVLADIAGDREFDFSKDLFPLLMARGERLCGYVASGYWSDIGNLEQYRRTQFEMLEGKVDVRIRGTEWKPGVWIGERVKASDLFELSGPAFIGSDCVLEQKAELGPYAVVGSGSLIRAEARVEQSVLWRHTAVERGAELIGATVGRNAVIGEQASLRDGAVVGDGSHVGGKAVIQPGVRLWPGKSVEAGARLCQSMIHGEFRSRSLFGEAGIQGAPYAELTLPFLSRLALAYAAQVPTGSRVTVGCDASPFAAIVAGALSSGLHASGLDTLELGMVPSAVSRHATHHTGAVGGIHIRRVGEAPEQYVITFWDAEGLPIDKGLERKIENSYAQEDCRKVSPNEGGRPLPYGEAAFQYRQGLLNMAEPGAVQAAGLSVVVAYDYRNLKGLLFELLEELGCSAIQLYAKAEPRELGRMVQVCKADLGVRLDKNGQVTSLVDETGEPLGDDLLGVLPLLLQLEIEAPEVAYVPVSVPDAVVESARRSGIRVVRTKNDFRSRLAALQKDGFHPGYDGLCALILLLRAMAERREPLSAWAGGVPRFALHQMTVSCTWSEKGQIMRFLMEETKGKRVELIDGIKIHHATGWLLIRPDSEEPMMRIVAHAASAEEAEQLAHAYVRMMERFRSRLSDEIVG